jgi:hypothetical protein
VAPAGDDEEARALGARIGARVTTVNGPADLPGALAALLGD